MASLANGTVLCMRCIAWRPLTVLLLTDQVAKLEARVVSLKEAISTAEGALHNLQAGEEQACQRVRTASAALQKAERCEPCLGHSYHANCKVSQAMLSHNFLCVQPSFWDPKLASSRVLCRSNMRAV